MGCVGQKGIKNLKSHISTQPVEYFEESGTQCHRCKINIKQESISLDTCGHSYHSKCMISLIEQQVEVKKQNIIKCTCGTKTSTNQIRQSNLPNKLILLNSLFRKQLELLLKQLRKKPDFKLILQQFEMSEQHPDFYFFPNQCQLEYEETPF